MDSSNAYSSTEIKSGLFVLFVIVMLFVLTLTMTVSDSLNKRKFR